MKSILRRLLRYLGWFAAMATVLLAAAIVTTITVDLGPFVRRVAEEQGAKRIERPLHIGRLGIRLLTGRFVVEDLVIDGLNPGDRPFFSARSLSIGIQWLPVFQRRPEFVVDEVVLSDWQMLVETFPNGRHNFPKFTSGGPAGPKRFTTTLRSFRGERGQFTFEEHGTPWSIVAPNLSLSITNLPKYHGEASFSAGTVAIQNFVPMRADMRCSFTLDGGNVHLDRIDLATDGSQSQVEGDVDLALFPQLFFTVRSRVDFQAMRAIFFKNETFTLGGQGDFFGTFHVYKGGRELNGLFSSDNASVNQLQFSRLNGSLLWIPDLFEVFETDATFAEGASKLGFMIRPEGPDAIKTATFKASYARVNLGVLTDQLAGGRMAGLATGRNTLEWPIGKFRERRGDGEITVVPPPGVAVMSRELAAQKAVEEDERGAPWGPFTADAPEGDLPIGGAVTYTLGPDSVVLKDGTFATPGTFVEFDGTTNYGDASDIQFHVTSADWQESDQVLAEIITDFGNRTRPVPFGGRGEFDGRLVGSFRNPRVEGAFAGDHIRAFDVVWGKGSAEVVIENSYVTVARGTMARDGSALVAEGRFSLGYPRRDAGEELNARFQLTNYDLATLRHAFQIDQYPVTGLVSGEFHLYGFYTRPEGFGSLAIADGSAYGERFEKATASMRFEGEGVRMDGAEIQKSTGRITGAAYIGWDGSYSFNADGRRLTLETLTLVTDSGAPLFGTMEFTAGGSGTFDAPRYDVRLRIGDLFVADEGVGQVTARLGIRANVLTLGLEAASPRLAVSGSGRMELTPDAIGDLSFRFSDTSLDPYVRAFVPRLSPFAAAIASGTVRASGPLLDLDRITVEATIDQVDLRLFDYRLVNAQAIHLGLDRHIVRVGDLRLVGDGTELDVTGAIDLDARRIAVQTRGNANLGILQGFYPDVRGSGRVALLADVQGPLDAPLFSGSADVFDGRIRYFGLPHSLDAINGRVVFDARRVRLDGVTAQMGGGEVRFGGQIGLEGYFPGELNVTAVGEGMQLRFPEGVRSIVDADLALRGNYLTPTLAGTITVHSALWSRRFDAGGGLLDLFQRRDEGLAPAGVEAFPLRLDLRIIAPSTLRVENNLARLVVSTDLTVRGTYDRPLIFGRADIDRGEVLFEGRRYLMTRGTIDFTNPARIEPFFDVEAETRVRVPGQTYRVTFRASGTAQRLVPEFNSDPPLATVDIISLLLGGATPGQDVEQRAALETTKTTQELLTARAAQFLASPISSEVGRVVEQTFGVDTFQLTPSLVDPYQQSSRLNPAARLTIGKRISDRAYLTYSRSLSSSTRDQIILLEIDQSDRLSWILSQNEDRTYALDVRVRRTF